MPFDAYAYAEANVGVSSSLSKDTSQTAETNVGVALPVQVNVSVPQSGWGSPLVPQRVATLLPEAANGYGYAEEEVTS